LKGVAKNEDNTWEVQIYSIATRISFIQKKNHKLPLFELLFPPVSV